MTENTDRRYCKWCSEPLRREMGERLRPATDTEARDADEKRQAGHALLRSRQNAKGRRLLAEARRVLLRTEIGRDAVSQQVLAKHPRVEAFYLEREWTGQYLQPHGPDFHSEGCMLASVNAQTEKGSPG